MFINLVEIKEEEILKENQILAVKEPMTNHIIILSLLRSSKIISNFTYANLILKDLASLIWLDIQTEPDR